MILTVDIIRGHIAVSDGCAIDQLESCVQDRKGPLSDSELDGLRRSSSNGPASEFLFYGSVGLSHTFYELRKEMEVLCPVCGERYVISREQWEVGERAYQEFIAED